MSLTTLKRGSVAIVGAAESDLGQVVPDMSPTDLMAQACIRALDDCGLKLSDVDGVFAACTQLSMGTVDVCEYLGIQPKYQDSTRIGGSAFMSLLAHAQLALQRVGERLLPEVGEAAHQHADRAGPPTAQGAGDGIGGVAELVGLGLDALDGGGRDVLAAQRVGDRGHGEAGLLRDLLHRGALAGHAGSLPRITEQPYCKSFQ